MSSKCLLYDSILKQKVIAHEESPQNAGVVLRFDICEVNIGRDWGQEEKGTTEDEMAGWHH